MSGRSKLSTVLAGALLLCAPAAAYDPTTGYDEGAFKASNISLDTVNFNLNLSSVDDNVQKAIERLDDLVGGGGGSVSDAVYGAGWNGDTTVAPSKNAVYDKIETIAAGGEVNTASNLGGGLANYDSKSVSDLRFNSFSGTDFDLATNLITIDAAIARDAEVAAAYQPLDSDLTTIAGLTATTNNFIVSVASAWASRTPTQAKATLAIANTDVSGLGTLSTQSGTFSGTSSGTNTGDQTSVTGNAGTVTTNANLTGVVTSVGNATAIADTALSIAKTSGLQSALDLKAPLASPTFTTPGAFTTGGTITLAENTSIALDPAGSADGRYTGITVTGTGGAVIAFGDLICLSQVDSRWELVDVSVAAASVGDARKMLGMAVTTSTDGGAITVLLQGIIRADANFPALTIGNPVYATTLGDVTMTQPSTTDHIIRVIGFSMTADELYFNPSNDYITRT